MWLSSVMVMLLDRKPVGLGSSPGWVEFFVILIDINKLQFQRDSIKVVGRKRLKLKGLGGKEATA